MVQELKVNISKTKRSELIVDLLESSKRRSKEN